MNIDNILFKETDCTKKLVGGNPINTQRKKNYDKPKRQ